MRILALDEATLKTGYAVFENDKMTEYGLLQKNKKDFADADTRCRAMALTMMVLIDEKKPDVVAIEDVALQKNAWVLIQLSRIQGEIIGYCDMNGIPIVILKPTQWRKAVGIKQGTKSRSLLKKDAKDFVFDHFGITVTEDEADAICIACAVLLNTQNSKEEDIDGNEDSDVRES